MVKKSFTYRYSFIGYNFNAIRQSACLVINPITVDGFAALFICTPMDPFLMILLLKSCTVYHTAEDIYTAPGWESMYQNGRLRGSAKSAIYTAAGCRHKIAIYMAAVPGPIQIYARLLCVHIKSLFTRQPFRAIAAIYIAAGRAHKIVIYTAAVQEPNRLYTLLPGVYLKLLFTWQLFKSQFKINC